MNNHHSIVYVPSKEDIREAICFVDDTYSGASITVKQLKDVFVFTKEELDKRDVENNQKGWNALQKIIDNRDNNWISVEDELPKSGEQVLCFTRSSGRMIENSYEDFVDQNRDWFKNRYSHWKSLPEPPKNNPNLTH